MVLPVLIAPSLLASDFSDMANEIQSVEGLGVDMLHVDVMDGHFVPNITMGPVIVKALNKLATTPLDVHIMISDPEKYADPFIDAGADILTFHVEATGDARGLIDHIHERGIKAGIAVSPETSITEIDDVLDVVDMVTIMTVRPGFGGQSFMSDMVEKINHVRENGRDGLWIQVDGGIGIETAVPCAEAGANVFVAGTSIFKAPDRKAAIEGIRAAGERLPD